MTDSSNTAQEAKQAAPSRLVSWLLIGLGLAVVALAGVRTIVSADIWTHVAVGRDIFYSGAIPRTATLTFALPSDSPWVDSTWLYDFGVATLWKFGGAKLLTVAHIAAVVLGFFVLSLRLLNKIQGAAWALAGALALAAWMLMQNFTPQPSLVAMFFLAIFLARASCGSCWKIGRWALPVMQVLWTNCHPSFLLGPLVALLFALDARRRESQGEEPEVPSRRLMIFAAVLLGVTFINPYGPGLHIWLVQVGLDPARHMMTDAEAAFALDFVPSALRFANYAAVAVISIGLLAIRQRLPLAFTCAAVLGAYLVLRTPQAVPLGAILVFPFVVSSLVAIAAQAPWAARLATPVIAAVLLALGIVMGSGEHLRRLGLASRVGLGIERDVYPLDVAAEIGAKVAFPPRMLNVAADGGFLATRLRSRDIYCDSRSSLFGGALYGRLTLALLGDPKAMQEIEAAHNPGAILINCNWSLAGAAVGALKQSGRWVLCYFDGSSALFVRNTPENLQFTRDRYMQRSGLKKLESARRRYEEALGTNGRRANSAQLAGAGRVFLALGKTAEAECVYRLLVAGAPNMHSAWLGHGITLTQMGRHDEALPVLERAAQMRPRDPLPLLWMSLAQEGFGQPEKAANAVERARSINKDFTEVFLKNPPLPRRSRP